MCFSHQHMAFLDRCSVCSAQALYLKYLTNKLLYRNSCLEIIEELQTKTFNHYFDFASTTHLKNICFPALTNYGVGALRSPYECVCVCVCVCVCAVCAVSRPANALPIINKCTCTALLIEQHFDPQCSYKLQYILGLLKSLSWSIWMSNIPEYKQNLFCMGFHVIESMYYFTLMNQR